MEKICWIIIPKNMKDAQEQWSATQENPFVLITQKIIHTFSVTDISTGKIMFDKQYPNLMILTRDIMHGDRTGKQIKKFLSENILHDETVHKRIWIHFGGYNSPPNSAQEYTIWSQQWLEWDFLKTYLPRWFSKANETSSTYSWNDILYNKIAPIIRTHPADNGQVFMELERAWEIYDKWQTGGRSPNENSTPFIPSFNPTRLGPGQHSDAYTLAIIHEEVKRSLDSHDIGRRAIEILFPIYTHLQQLVNVEKPDRMIKEATTWIRNQTERVRMEELSAIAALVKLYELQDINVDTAKVFCEWFLECTKKHTNYLNRFIH